MTAPLLHSKFEKSQKKFIVFLAKSLMSDEWFYSFWDHIFFSVEIGWCYEQKNFFKIAYALKCKKKTLGDYLGHLKAFFSATKSIEGASLWLFHVIEVRYASFVKFELHYPWVEGGGDGSRVRVGMDIGQWLREIRGWQWALSEQGNC